MALPCHTGILYLQLAMPCITTQHSTPIRTHSTVIASIISERTIWKEGMKWSTTPNTPSPHYQRIGCSGGWVNMHAQVGECSTTLQISNIWLRICRFFAAHQIRATIAYILLNYDIRLEGEKTPGRLWGAHASRPDPGAHLMFKQRSRHQDPKA